MSYFDCTLIIPAAGKGSRLGFSGPKILFKLNGESILKHICSRTIEQYKKVIIVASPEGKESVEAEINARGWNSIFIVEQKKPLGMADAVLCGLKNVETKYVAVQWGDQPFISRETIQRTKEKMLNLDLPICFPTMKVENPYIYIQRDTKNMISEIYEFRENPSFFKDKKIGEKDIGYFLFKTTFLSKILNKNLTNSKCYGSETGEYNLIPQIVEMAKLVEFNITVECLNELEEIGINSHDDVKKLEKYL